MSGSLFPRLTNLKARGDHVNKFFLPALRRSKKYRVYQLSFNSFVQHIFLKEIKALI